MGVGYLDAERSGAAGPVPAGSRGPAPIGVLANGVDTDYFRSPVEIPPKPVILFSGKMSYHANVAAAMRLVDAVMPAVWQVRPDALLVIAGKDPPAPSSGCRSTSVNESVSLVMCLICVLGCGRPASLRPHARSAPVFRTRCQRPWPAVCR